MVAPTPNPSPARSRTVAVDLFLPNDLFHALPDVRPDGASHPSESPGDSDPPRLSPLPPLVDSSSDDDGVDLDLSLGALMEACWLFCRRATDLYFSSQARGWLYTQEHLQDEVATLLNKFAVLRGELRPLWSDDHLWGSLVEQRRMFKDCMDTLEGFNACSSGMLWGEIYELNTIAWHLHHMVGLLWSLRKGVHLVRLSREPAHEEPLR